MKYQSFGLMFIFSVLAVVPANANKSDYCAAYARDFADAQTQNKTQDKTIWQHKYDIASTSCMADPKPAPIKVIKPPPPAIAPVITPPEPVIAATSVKPSKPAKLEPGSEAWNAYCAKKYTSFNPKTGLYLSLTRVARKCLVTGL